MTQTLTTEALPGPFPLNIHEILRLTLDGLLPASPDLSALLDRFEGCRQAEARA